MFPTGRERDATGYRPLRQEDPDLVPIRTAYVQGDWTTYKEVDSPVGENQGERISNYENLLRALYDLRVANIASWHPKAQGAQAPVKGKSAKALRNMAQIQRADMVISYMQRPNFVSLHGGSIALIGYAIALNKPCFVVADKDCLTFQNHVMHHPLVTRFDTVAELLEMIKITR